MKISRGRARGILALLASCGLVVSAAGCAAISAMDAARWGCIAGTFLGVAGKNFGGHYLGDAATLASLFINAGSEDRESSGLTPGCHPVENEEEFPDWVPDQGAEPVAFPEPEYEYAPEEGWAIAPPEGYAEDGYYAGQPEYAEASGDYVESYAIIDEAGAFESAQWQTPVADHFTLDVSLVRAENVGGRISGVPMRDGEVLRRSAGDRFQIYLAPGFDAFLYVYAVDATGWVQRLHPDESRGHVNPIRAGEDVVLPRPGYYLGLDEYSGTHEIWFLASPQPRREVARQLSLFSLDRPRPRAQITSRSADDPGPATMSRASVFTRGLIELGPAPPVPMTGADGSTFSVTPARLFGDISEGEIAFSRWFEAR